MFISQGLKRRIHSRFNSPCKQSKQVDCFLWSKIRKSCNYFRYRRMLGRPFLKYCSKIKSLVRAPYWILILEHWISHLGKLPTILEHWINPVDQVVLSTSFWIVNCFFACDDSQKSYPKTINIRLQLRLTCHCILRCTISVSSHHSSGYIIH